MSMENKVKYADRYAKRGCTIEQLKKLVKLNALTPDEFKEITGMDYSAE